MKMTPRQYVRILEMLQEQYPNDSKKVVELFAFALRRNRGVGLFAKIARAYKQQQIACTGGETVVLHAAHSFSKEAKDDLEERIRRTRKNVEMHIEWKMDERIEGGLRMQIGEQGLDESIGRRFRSLDMFLREKNKD